MKLAVKYSLLLSSIFLTLFVMVLASYPTLAADNAAIDQTICDEAKANAGEIPSFCNPSSGTQTSSDNALVGPNGIITRVTKVLIWASGTLGMILIIIAGFMFMFSSGNPESTGRARSTIIYALIGVTIAVVSQLVVSFVLDKL